jgi:hypothetical protein
VPNLASVASFNPLERINLAKSIEREMLAQECQPLPPGTFGGAGIYAIYYLGSFPAYQPISTGSCEFPIYVGKASPSGSQRGGFLDAPAGRALANRLREHASSIEQADNLDLADFRCRYLVVEDIWIPLGESLMISHFEPVWNMIVEGFGKHASGAGRAAGRRSMWDTIHPGRPWALAEQPRAETAEEILVEITAFFAQKTPPEAKLHEIEEHPRVATDDVQRAETEEDTNG